MKRILAFTIKPTLEPVTVSLRGELTGSASVVGGNVLVYYVHDEEQKHQHRHFATVWAGKPLPDNARFWATVDLGEGQIVHVVEVL